MRRARSNLCDSWFARDHMQPRRRILSRRRCPHGAADRWMARCVAAWPSLGMREYALQLASTPRTTDQAMGISRRGVRQANGSAYLNDLQRKDNERGKRASGCAHKAGKRRDGNLVRCIGCDKVVGLWRAPQATTRRAVRRPSPRSYLWCLTWTIQTIHLQPSNSRWIVCSGPRCERRRRQTAARERADARAPRQTLRRRRA